MNKKKPVLAGIYKIESPSGRVYIGQSWNIRLRWFQHSGKKNIVLSNSYKKYGKQNHKFTIIHELPLDVSQEIMDAYEIFYIECYNNTGAKSFNLRGGGSRGKISEATKNKLRTYERTTETREKMSKSQRGKKRTAERIEQMRVQMLSFKHTEESKRKIGEKSKMRFGD